MLNSLPIVLTVGTVLGFLSGVGVGGGSLLMLWLTLVVGTDHTTARIINLLFFLPCAVIASFFRWKQGNLDVRKVLPAIIGGCISAALFSMIGRQLDIAILKKLFGILLLTIGVKELLYRPRAAR